MIMSVAWILNGGWGWPLPIYTNGSLYIDCVFLIFLDILTDDEASEMA
jgi:hypothetical protein